MSIKLINVIEEPVFVFQDAETGETKQVNGYLWSWGDYFDLYLDNVPAFAEWVQLQPDLTLDQLEDFGDLQQLVYRMDDEVDE